MWRVEEIVREAWFGLRSQDCWVVEQREWSWALEGESVCDSVVRSLSQSCRTTVEVWREDNLRMAT